jgi:hypothetical protein
MKVTQNYFISNSLKMTANKFLKLYQGVVANAVIDPLPCPHLNPNPHRSAQTQRSRHQGQLSKIQLHLERRARILR